MQVMSSSRRFQIFIFLLASFGIRFSNAFEFDIPSTVISGIPISVGYRLEDGDPRRWKVNVTDTDDTRQELLNNGEIFEAKEVTGTFSVTIDRDGIFLLKAVDPSSPSKVYATSRPNVAWDHPVESREVDEDGYELETVNVEDGEVVVEGGEDEVEASDFSASGAKFKSTSESESESEPKSKSKSKPNVALIVGCVIAAVVVIMLIICAILFFVRQRKQAQQQPTRRVTFYRDRMVKDEDDDDQKAQLPMMTEKQRTSPKKVPPPLPLPAPLHPILLNPHDRPTYGGFRDAYPGGGPPPVHPLPPPPVQVQRLRESEAMAYSKH